MNQITVSACIITYNHEKHISEAIMGALNQKLDYTYEIVIGEDASSDSTGEICREFKKKYPKKIKLIQNNQNLGMVKNWGNILNHCTGKYIALCEGDDYWTDPHKLQKQIDFLENEKDYILCFHNAWVLDDNGDRIRLFNNNFKNDTFSGKDLLKTWLMSTASVVFRNILHNDIPDYFYLSTHADLSLFLFLADFGKIKYLNETMGVYRIHSGGITVSRFKGIEHNQKHINQCKAMNVHFRFKYSLLLKKRIAEYHIANAQLYIYENQKKNAIANIKQSFANYPWMMLIKLKAMIIITIGLISYRLLNLLKGNKS